MRVGACADELRIIVVCALVLTSGCAWSFSAGAGRRCAGTGDLCVLGEPGGSEVLPPCLSAIRLASAALKFAKASRPPVIDRMCLVPWGVGGSKLCTFGKGMGYSEKVVSTLGMSTLWIQ